MHPFNDMCATRLHTPALNQTYMLVHTCMYSVFLVHTYTNFISHEEITHMHERIHTHTDVWTHAHTHTHSHTHTHTHTLTDSLHSFAEYTSVSLWVYRGRGLDRSMPHLLVDVELRHLGSDLLRRRGRFGGWRGLAGGGRVASWRGLLLGVAPHSTGGRVSTW